MVHNLHSINYFLRLVQTDAVDHHKKRLPQFKKKCVNELQQHATNVLSNLLSSLIKSRKCEMLRFAASYLNKVVSLILSFTVKSELPLL